MLGSTTEITNANKKIKKIKKIERTINFVKLKLDIHSNTFLVKVVLDIALKIYCLFFPKETPLPGVPKKIIIKQVMFQIDIKENKDING